MEEKHGKIKNLGALTDGAYGKYKSNFYLQAAATAVICGFFAIFLILLSHISLHVVWPSLPNFTGNQMWTDGIILGIIFVIIFLFAAFFLSWQNAAAVAVCRSQNESIGMVAKAVGKAALPAFTILLAQIALFLPVIAVFAVVIATNISNLSALLPLILVGFFAVLILLRVAAFFAITVALTRNGNFFVPILKSIGIVRLKGFFKVFLLATFVSLFNLVLYAGLLILLINIFGQIPAGFFGLADLMYYILYTNTMGAAAVLLLAYLPLAFFAPKLNVLAYGIFSHTTKSPSPPGITSRALATALDLVLCALGFSAAFYGIAALVYGGGINPFRINPGAAATSVIAFFIVFMIYNVYFEVFEKGKTPGKRFFGLIVVTNQGEPPNLLNSLIRNILRIVDTFGFIIMIFNEKHHRLGDIMSLTTVEYDEEGDEDVS